MNLFKSISSFNRLNGKLVSRSTVRSRLRKIATNKELAASTQGKKMVEILNKILTQMPEAGSARIYFDPIPPAYGLAGKNKPIEVEVVLYGIERAQAEDGVALDGPEKIYDFITEMIVKAIKKDGLIWRKAWSTPGEGIPASNFITKKPYRGLNSFLLNFYARIVQGKTHPYWLTFGQVEKLGGKIRKGAKSSVVIYYDIIYRHAETGEELAESDIESMREKEYYAVPLVRYYRVFNGNDITGIDWKLPPPPNNHERIESAERIVENMPKAPVIYHRGDRAYYSPRLDNIVVPEINYFDREQEYYSTLFHEMVHSTAHKSRIGRDMSGRFGSKAYAFEELIAEIGASFLSGEAGILYHTLDNSAAYIKGWKKRLIAAMEDDNKFIFRAAAQAQRAADYILARGEYEKLKKKKSSVKQKELAPALGNPAPPTNGQPDSLFVRADQAPPQPEDVFTLPGPIGKLLGKLQRYKLAIALHGDYHGGKSEFAMQLIDAFADRGMRVGLFDLEQGGLYSKDTLASIKRNIKPGNRSRLAVAAEAPGGLDEIKRYADKFDVIVIDSWQKLGFITNEKFDELRKEYPNTIWVVIFQQNAAGEVRGGAAANYDAPVVLRAVRADRYDFSRNYIEVKKNRGNPTDRWYMIAAKRVVNNIPEHKPEKDGNSTS